MPDSERRKRGAETIAKVYAGDVVVPPEGASAFADLMLEQVFAEVWTRPALTIRERRLLIMGAIAALGEGMTWKIQLRAALKNRRAHARAGARDADPARAVHRLSARGGIARPDGRGDSRRAEVSARRALRW